MTDPMHLQRWTLALLRSTLTVRSSPMERLYFSPLNILAIYRLAVLWKAERVVQSRRELVQSWQEPMPSYKAPRCEEEYVPRGVLLPYVPMHVNITPSKPTTLQGTIPMTDQTPSAESPITDRAHQELAEALGLSPHTGKTWDDLLKLVRGARLDLNSWNNLQDLFKKNKDWIKNVGAIAGVEHDENFRWETFLEQVKARISYVTREMRESIARRDAIIRRHQQLTDALGMEHGVHWEALVDKAKDQTKLIQDRDSHAVRDLTIQLNKALHVPIDEAESWQVLIELIQKYHHTLADAVDAGRSDHWKYVISKVEEQKRLLDISERYRRDLTEVAAKERTTPLSWEALFQGVKDLSKSTANPWLESYEKLRAYQNETEALKEELAKRHGQDPRLPLKDILQQYLARPLGIDPGLSWEEMLGSVTTLQGVTTLQEELGQARKTVASELQWINDLEQLVKDKAADLTKMGGRVDLLENEREQLQAKINLGELSYPPEALNQAHENGYKEGLAKAIDLARMVVQQTKEDLDAKRKAIDEAQAQKAKAEEEERKAALEHIVAYDLLKMVEDAQTKTGMKPGEVPATLYTVSDVTVYLPKDKKP